MNFIIKTILLIAYFIFLPFCFGTLFNLLKFLFFKLKYKINTKCLDFIFDGLAKKHLIVCSLSGVIVLSSLFISIEDPSLPIIEKSEYTMYYNAFARFEDYGDYKNVIAEINKKDEYYYISKLYFEKGFLESTQDYYEYTFQWSEKNQFIAFEDSYIREHLKDAYSYYLWEVTLVDRIKDIDSNDLCNTLLSLDDWRDVVSDSWEFCYLCEKLCDCNCIDFDNDVLYICETCFKEYYEKHLPIHYGEKTFYLYKE